MDGGFDFHIVFHSIPFLAKGMWLTLELTFLGIVGGLFFGTLLALCRLGKYRVLAFVAATYVNFFRSMPLYKVKSIRLYCWQPSTKKIFRGEQL